MWHRMPVAPLLLQADVPTATWSGSLAADTGWSNSLRYTTPEINGLKANLHYQFGESAGRTGVRVGRLADRGSRPRSWRVRNGTR